VVEDVVEAFGFQCQITATCGYCEGTGVVTPAIRGEWLRHRKEEKRMDKVIAAMMRVQKENTNV
jgi:hypothetical protein